MKSVILRLYDSSLEGDHPTLEIGNTLLKDGKWLVSGTMTVKFKAGHFGQAKEGLAITMPFEAAEDEAAAIQKAATALKAAGEDLTRIANALLRKEPPSRT